MLPIRADFWLKSQKSQPATVLIHVQEGTPSWGTTSKMQLVQDHEDQTLVPQTARAVLSHVENHPQQSWSRIKHQSRCFQESDVRGGGRAETERV